MKRWIRWPIGTLMLALVLGFGAAAPALAQSDTGEISISVVDAKSSDPVANARTILIGPTTASSLTTAAGAIHYTDVPAGIYRVRVFRTGYDSGHSKDFEVLGGRAVAVQVELAPSAQPGLKVIGTVTARSRVTVTSNDISDTSAVRRISDSLSDALDKLAGVSVTQSSSDPDAAVTVSLRNHDESQTAITLDGIPLGPSGSSVNLRAVNTDLFSGATTNFSPSAGSLGGAVNFRTLQPTQTWQGKFSGTTGTFDRSNYQVATTGSFGKLGIAAQHTWRGANAPLTFQDYLDQSGLTYDHGGESRNLGDFLKFRYNMNDRMTFSGTALSSNNAFSSLCTQYITIVPCGSGPGNGTSGHFGFAYGTLQALVGTVATQVSVFTNANRSESDFLNRYVVGQPRPSQSEQLSNAHGISYSASIAHARHTITLSGNTYASTNESRPIVGSAFVTPFTTSASSTTEQFSDVLKANDKLSLNARLSLASTSGVGSGILGGLGASWRPQAGDSFDGSLSFGSSQPGTNVNKSFSDPVTARYDCTAGTAVVSGPGDSPGHQSALNFDLAWTHQMKFGSVTVAAYRQRQSGQLINALVSAASEPSGYFPNGYLGAIGSQFQLPLVCGAAATLAPSGIYIVQPIGGTERTYAGFDLSARIALGRNAVVLPTYSSSAAVLTSADQRLLGATSTSIVGAQLPGRPVHRAGLTIDALHPKSGTEFLVNAQWTGANNFQNLGSYIVANAGISHNMGPGRLTLFENNVFNTDAGKFTTDAYAQPIRLSNGTNLSVAAIPLTPRTIALSYSFTIGGPRPPASLSPASLIPAASKTVAGSPSSGGGPRGLQIRPVPPPAGVDPLSVAADRESCTADARKVAEPLLDALKRYVAAYEAKSTVTDIESVTVTSHPIVAGALPYYLELRPKFAGAAGASAGSRGPSGSPGGSGFGGRGEGNPGEGPFQPPAGVPPSGARPAGGPSQGGQPPPQFRTFAGFLGCAYVTAMSADEAKAKGIELQQGRPGLFYAPSIGIVAVRPPELPQGGGSVKRP